MKVENIVPGRYTHATYSKDWSYWKWNILSLIDTHMQFCPPYCARTCPPTFVFSNALLIAIFITHSGMYDDEDWSYGEGYYAQYADIDEDADIGIVNMPYDVSYPQLPPCIMNWKGCVYSHCAMNMWKMLAVTAPTVSQPYVSQSACLFSELRQDHLVSSTLQGSCTCIISICMIGNNNGVSQKSMQLYHIFCLDSSSHAHPCLHQFSHQKNQTYFICVKHNILRKLSCWPSFPHHYIVSRCVCVGAYTSGWCAPFIWCKRRQSTSNFWICICANACKHAL